MSFAPFVLLEMTGSAWEIVRIREPDVARVIVVSPGNTGIVHARANTDRLDARTLARLFARKLGCLFWCLLTRDQHYAHGQPSLTATKLRKVDRMAGAKRYERSAAGIYATNEAMREAERKLAEQAEASCLRMVRDWQAAAPRKPGASATPERAYR